MTELVDALGKPLAQSSELELAICPVCSSRDLESSKGFGGHWKVICKKCGQEVARGQLR